MNAPPQMFTGVSHSLDGSAGTKRGAVAAPPPRAPSAEERHVITFYTNGFTVDNGPLRRFDDVANTQLLESVKNGTCPKEFEPVRYIFSV